MYQRTRVLINARKTSHIMHYGCAQVPWGSLLQTVNSDCVPGGGDLPCIYSHAG